MNRREANDLREALKKLEHGPGSGWLRVIAGTDDIGPKRTDEERARSVAIWMDSWITPAIRPLIDRYWKGIPAGRRRQSPPSPPTTAAKLNAIFREGETLEARGREEAPYFVGFYKSIAKQAIERLVELEEARS